MVALTSVELVDQRRRVARRARLDAQAVLWRESGLDRLRDCGRVGVLPGGAVSVRAGGFAGLATCGSTWSCPVCSYKIASARSDELGQAVAAWEARGGRVVMVTLTMRHDERQELAELWDNLSYAWSKVTSGRGWVSDQALYGVHGWARVVEATHGDAGWHVHVHSLLFIDPQLVVDAVEGVELADVVHGLGASMFQRWRDALVRKGMRAPLAGSGGLDVRLTNVGDGYSLGDYFAKGTYDPAQARKDRGGKLGREVAMGASKQGRRGNRTPFQLLADVVELGVVRDLALWHEWEKASHGRRQLTWSKGLRSELVVDQELDDQELAEQERGGEDLVVLPAPSWQLVLLLDLRAKLVEASSDGRADTVRAVLFTHGVPWEDPPEREDLFARLVTSSQRTTPGE